MPVFETKAGSTIRGQFCAPGGNGRAGAGVGAGAGSCYSRQQLVAIANAYNNKHSSGSRISTKGTKEELWRAIDQRMEECDSEWCWLGKLNLTARAADAFRPVRPGGSRTGNWKEPLRGGSGSANQWLSTTDIRKVLTQYEQVYPEFVFLGPVPIDFCQLAGNEVCNINLKTLKLNGKTKVGIVFNTDPSDQPGKHWICMFIDLSDSDPRRHEVAYFDSYGLAPLLPEIKALITNLKRQNPYIITKLNCQDQMCTRSVRHQLGDSECGMYCINFIVARLTGQSWEDIVLGPRWTDEQMLASRSHFFRPN